MVSSQVLALIPARGGSKSIPRKNVRFLGDHPLLAYSIAAGSQAESVSRVIVSTDEEEIAAVARRYGAETPFLRPQEFARDETPDLPVFQHALRWLAEHESYQPEIVVQLRPTSPFRPFDCVDSAVQILLDHPEADSVRGVVPSGQNPYKMWRLPKGEQDGPMVPLLDSEFEEAYNMPRQKLPPTYWQTGHIDAVRTHTILRGNSMSGKVVYPLVIDPRYTIDLDTPLDWERAEWRMKDPAFEIVRPASGRAKGSAPPQGKRSLPEKVNLVVLDFDGVITDNRVYVNEEGVEMVAANRGDGMGIEMLKEAGVEIMILSTETNKVVAARARKLNVPVLHGVGNKAKVIRGLLEKKRVASENTVYLGNDVNDLPCFPLVGCAFAVADAHPAARAAADIILSKDGGRGAVRELCDMILASIESS